jgi:UDP-2-acetamido-3-amino-2,3-dideoxy-glucuronate N-acetyltransferase
LIDSKKLGFVIMIVGPVLTAIYAIELIFDLSLVVQLTALIFMVIFLGIVTWIGYTMFTEPAMSRPLPSEADLENLEEETINPPPLEGSTDDDDESLRVTRSSFSVVTDCSIGERTEIRDHVNLYKCKIGTDCKIESFVYIEEGVVIGDRCKIKPNVFIPTGVSVGDDVFIGPNATFTNDKHPHVSGDWELLLTKVGRGASIGAHSVILPGVRIGENAVIGAGAVVTKDVPPNSIAVGNPARVLEEKKSTLHGKIAQ